MEWAIVMALAQMGFSIYQTREQERALSTARSQTALTSAANQSRLVVEQQRARREAQGAVQGSVLGGNVQANIRSQGVSQRGTTLTSNPQTRSLLGG